MESLEEGIFIAMEGLDGSGQSTQAEKLAQFLREEGIPVKEEKEPTDNLVGGLIRGQLSGAWDSEPECLQLLFAADRSHHLETEILPALQEGYVVIVDRYMFSSLAYGAMDLELDWLQEINKLFPVPDITFFIDVPPDTCLERMQRNRFSLELFEKRQLLKQVAAKYEEIIPQYDSIHRIDADKSIERVHYAILSELKEFLENGDEAPYDELLDRIGTTPVTEFL
jgi:dTMP kinase